jgi:cystine transport system ATP-binding protein
MIELSNIEKRFGDAIILKDISIRIPEGSVTALVGPSGGGKSTLLRCINLLEIPTAGSIRLGEEKLAFAPGKRTSWQAIQKIRRQTGMVFQNFQLFPHQTAIENVMEGLVTVLRWPKEKARVRAMELLTKVGMTHKADAWPSTLSGGQQQRVAIARALLNNPSILFADEPTGNLDSRTSVEVMDIFQRLKQDRGITIVLITHEPQVAEYGSRIIAFKDGQIVSDQANQSPRVAVGELALLPAS